MFTQITHLVINISNAQRGNSVAKKLILICLGMSLLLEVKPQDWFQMEFLSPFFCTAGKIHESKNHKMFHQLWFLQSNISY